ncbi:MAG: protein BatD [Bdellovibrionales bacterium]|nr:protein BatD [Bdellovibrionales bacterium]
MKLLSKILIVSFFLISISHSEVKVFLTIDQENLDVGDQLSLEVTVEGTRDSTTPMIKGTENFSLVSRGSSSQFQMINGRTTVSVKTSYEASLSKAGSFIIGPAEVEVEGKIYRSNQVRIKVSKGNNNYNQNNEYYKIDSIVENKYPYVNQQIVYTFRLLTKVSLREAQVDIPDFDGFWKEQLGNQNNYEKIINGVVWQVMEIQYALFPLGPGQLTIPEVTLKAKILVPDKRRNNRRRGSMLDSFFSDSLMGRRGKLKNVKLTSNKILLNIKDLPSLNKPDGFTGLVGQYDLDVTIDKNIIKKGDSLTLTTEISGRGNIFDAKGPAYNISGFKSYDDKPTLKKIIDENKKIVGKKIFKKALVPQNLGVRSLGTISLYYFDPDQADYMVINKDLGEINVQRSAGDDEVNHMTISERLVEENKQEIKVLAEGLMPNKESVSFLTNFYNSTIYNLMLFFSFFFLPLLNLLFYFFTKSKQRKSRDLGLLRKEKAFKNYKSEANKISLDENFFNDTSLAFRRYIGNKLNVDGLAVTPIDLERVLAPYRISTGIEHEILQLLKSFEKFQYGGSSSVSKKEFKKHVDSLVKKIEKEKI